MIAAASAASRRARSSASPRVAGTTASTSFRVASGAPAAAAQAVSDETPGITRTGYRSTIRSKRKLNDP